MRRQHQRFQALLESKRAEIANSIRHQRGALRIEAGGDAVDRLLGAKEREKAVRELERSAEQMQQIDEALRRIREGTFGTCTECARAITASRLNAIPWARLCVSCQERADSESNHRAGYLPMPAA